MDKTKNEGIQVGGPIVHKSCEYVIVDIRCDEGMDGAELIIRAFDPHKSRYRTTEENEDGSDK